jgi:hypothetical protein
LPGFRGGGIPLIGSGQDFGRVGQGEGFGIAELFGTGQPVADIERLALKDRRFDTPRIAVGARPRRLVAVVPFGASNFQPSGGNALVHQQWR